MNSKIGVLTSLWALLLVISCTTVAQADALQRPDTGKKIKVFILAGQSNMEGRADGNKLTPDDIQRLEKAQGQVQLAFNYSPIRALNVVEPSKEIGEIYNVEQIFGPELFFGISLSEAWSEEKILLIKLSGGGTSLHGCWNPEWRADKAATMGEEKEPKLYPALTTYVKQVLSGYGEEEYEICALLWVQGETDSGNKTAAAAYGNNLQTLVEHIRQDVGYESLPFLLFQVGRGKVVEGMKRVAQAMSNVTLIPQHNNPDSTDFYPKLKNGHYNHVGMKKMGGRFAQTFLKIPVQ